MLVGNRNVELSAEAYDLACRGAALDRIDLAMYFEIVVMRDAEHIRTREFVETRALHHLDAPEQSKAIDDDKVSRKPTSSTDGAGG